MMKRALADCERKDLSSKADGWIEKLVGLYVDLIEMKKLQGDNVVLSALTNTKIVTLNYERCLEEHFHKPIYRCLCYSEFADPNFIMTHKSDLQSRVFFTRHPHGAIGAGSLEKIEGGTIDRVQCVSKVKSGGYKSNVGAFTPYGRISFDVDLDLVGDDPLNENYKELNETIEESSNCIVMGLSGVGLQGCRVDWSKFGTVYYFGADNYEFEGACVERIYCTNSSKRPDMQLIEWLSKGLVKN